jgi:cell division protein ZapA
MNQTLEAQTREATQATEQPAAEPTQSQSIAVEIYDQIYHLRGTDPVYIERLAAMVDAKMRAVSAHGNTVDSLRVAVLAALNIADEPRRQPPELPAILPLPRRQSIPPPRRTPRRPQSRLSE